MLGTVRADQDVATGSNESVVQVAQGGVMGPPTHPEIFSLVSKAGALDVQEQCHLGAALLHRVGHFQGHEGVMETVGEVGQMHDDLLGGCLLSSRLTALDTEAQGHNSRSEDGNEQRSTIASFRLSCSIELRPQPLTGKRREALKEKKLWWCDHSHGRATIAIYLAVAL